MGEKKKKNNNKGAENEEAKKGGDNNAMLTMVFKTEMHCEGCASKILKYVKSIEGVEKAKTEWEANKLTVVGEVDPVELRDMLLEKTKKKVELVSPQVKKDKENKADNNNENNKSNSDNNKNNPQDKKSEDKKSKEKEVKPPVTTADLKVDLHCGGCIVKIHKIVSKAEGVQSATINKEKNLITVKGTMDVKEIAQTLKDKMKRQVEIVPPKKEKDKEGSKGSDGAEKEDGGGGGKKKKKKGSGGGDGGEEKEEKIDGGQMQGNRVEYYGPPPPQGYGFMPMQAPMYGYPYGYMYGHPLHAPQMFSDENPNACSVM